MKATVLLLVAILAAVVASSALAGGNSSAKATYGNRGTNVQRSLGKPKTSRPQTTTTPVAKSQGTLPFTGLDLALVAGGGVLLVGTGASLRRLTRKNPGV